MSYCKFGPDSDVYLYSSTHYPDNTPCWALMIDSALEPETLFSRQAALDRLLALRNEGRRVPDAALERLQGEMPKYPGLSMSPMLRPKRSRRTSCAAWGIARPIPHSKMPLRGSFTRWFVSLWICRSH